MAKVRRVDFSPDEWLAGTAILDSAERGLYITACALIWSHGGPIEVAHLKACTRDHGHAFNRQLKRLVDLGKLVFEGLRLTNKRAIKELQNADKRATNARQNGAQHKKNNKVANPLGVTINYQEELSYGVGESSSIGAKAPLGAHAREAVAKSASDPPMGDALDLTKRGEQLIGNSHVVEQQIAAVGPDQVSRALDAIERSPNIRKRVAYFLACCRGPQVVQLTKQEIAQNAAEELERARLECYREAGICIND